MREVSEREGVTGIDGRLFFLLFVRFSGVLISYFAAQPVVVNLLRSVTQRGGTQTAIHPFHCQEQKGNDARRDLSLKLGEPRHYFSSTRSVIFT